jgi:hypothetical protein
MAEWKDAEFALAGGSVLQRPAVEAVKWFLRADDTRARIDQLLFLFPADRPEIEAGEILRVELHDARADQPIAEADRIRLDFQYDDVPQKLAELRRIQIGTQRNAVGPTPHFPIALESQDATGFKLREIKPSNLVDHIVDDVAAVRRCGIRAQRVISPALGSASSFGKS